MVNAGGTRVRSGRVDCYQVPGWPGSDTPKRYHLDLQVDDVAKAVERGAWPWARASLRSSPAATGGRCSPTRPDIRSACARRLTSWLTMCSGVLSAR